MQMPYTIRITPTMLLSTSNMAIYCRIMLALSILCPSTSSRTRRSAWTLSTASLWKSSMMPFPLAVSEWRQFTGVIPQHVSGSCLPITLKFFTTISRPRRNIPRLVRHEASSQIVSPTFSIGTDQARLALLAWWQSIRGQESAEW